MRKVLFQTVVFLIVSAVNLCADQPRGIVLNANGVSKIYPVFDTSGWVLTQPAPGRVSLYPDYDRVTHFGDDYYAQDWSRTCGQTLGQRVYAGISGKIILAGPRGPYGNTVVIYEDEAKFVLKYSHLDEVLVSVGGYVLAGRTLIGRVGRTGNIQSTSCTQDAGAHLHLSLHRNVSDPGVRPVTQTSADYGAGPTWYAANFAYTSTVDLAKSSSDPTVYVVSSGTKTPVSGSSFESNGWNFDKYQSLFNPLSGRIYDQIFLNSISTTKTFWPHRENVLIKGSLEQTVYVFSDSRKLALTYSTFNCRGLRFGEVKTINQNEVPRYLPNNQETAFGCVDPTNLAVSDLIKWSKQDYRFGVPKLSTYTFYESKAKDWDLRSLAFRFTGLRTVVVFHAISKSDSQRRIIQFFDPDSKNWRPWISVF